MENMTGAGVLKSDVKSWGGLGECGFMVVGEDGGERERLEETDLRFVRAGVRDG